MNIVGLLSLGLRKSRWLQLFNRKRVNCSQTRSHILLIIRKVQLPKKRTKMKRKRNNKSWGRNNKLFFFLKPNKKLLKSPWAVSSHFPCTRVNKASYASGRYTSKPICVFHFQAERWNIFKDGKKHLKYWGGAIFCYIISNLIPTQTIYQYVLNLQKGLNIKRTVTYMQNSLFQHETLGHIF